MHTGKIRKISLITSMLLVTAPLLAAASVPTNQPNPPGANSSQPTTYYLSTVTVTASAESPSYQWRAVASFSPISSFVSIDSRAPTAQVQGTGNIDGFRIILYSDTENCVYEYHGSYKITGKAALYPTMAGYPKGAVNFQLTHEPNAVKASYKSGPTGPLKCDSSSYQPYGLSTYVCWEILGQNRIDIAKGGASYHYNKDGITYTCTVKFNASVPTITPQCAPTAKTGEELYYGVPYKFGYQIVDGKGLVFQDITAGEQHLFDSVSVPHFKIDFFNGKSKIIRYCDPSDPQSYTKYIASPPKIINNYPSKDKVTLSWAFTRAFNIEQDGVRGYLDVSYEVVISNIASNNCEGLEFECYWFIPKVTYKWTGALGSEISRFTAYYKLDYGPNGGLARVKDGDGAGALKNPGYQSLASNEVGFLAVRNGQAGEYDNIHAIYSPPGGTIFIPGCQFGTEFSCAHIHWRWSDFEYGPRGPLDPMVEPSTGQPILDKKRGTPHLVPGQTIAIAIVKHNPGEDDPDDISRLLNNEQIGTVTPYEGQAPDGSAFHRCTNCFLSGSAHPVVWYVASVANSNMDTFFRHGIFVLDTKLGDVHAHGVTVDTNSTEPLPPTTEPPASTTPQPTPTPTLPPPTEPPGPTCSDGQVLEDGECVIECPDDQVVEDGECVDPPDPTCPDDQVVEDGECVDPPEPREPSEEPGEVWN